MTSQQVVVELSPTKSYVPPLTALRQININTTGTTTNTNISPIYNATTTPTFRSTYTESGTNLWDIDSTRFPYLVIVIVIIWSLLVAGYFISRWRQKSKDTYIVPRVFVLCSPRNVQFHYELILRVGLPSYDFNPEKYDIDLSVQGQQKNEVVPITRLNTKTLIDEPLITNLSLVVYRLVEMPPLGALLLNHSGPFKSWVYAYDFTVIDLSTNKEQYYTINQYIGALSRLVSLEEPNTDTTVNFPIDDVPLPHWTNEDIFLILFAVLNWIILSISVFPINCDYLNDIYSILLASLGGGTLVFFLNWLIYYQMKWDQERKEFFNESISWRMWPGESTIRVCVIVMATIVGVISIYYVCSITNPLESVVWSLAIVNSCVLVIGLWNAARLTNLGQGLVGLGLKLKGTEMVSIGMRYSEMVPDIRTKSGSASDDGSSTISGQVSKMRQNSLGTRSSVKSFGFSLLGLKGKTNSSISSLALSPSGTSRISRMATQNSNQPKSMINTGAPSSNIGSPRTSYLPGVTKQAHSPSTILPSQHSAVSHSKSQSQSKSKKGAGSVERSFTHKS